MDYIVLEMIRLVLLLQSMALCISIMKFLRVTKKIMKSHIRIILQRVML